MFERVQETCSKCTVFSLFSRRFDCEHNESMIPRIALILFFVSSVAVAVFVSIFPNISYLFGKKPQLSLTVNIANSKQTGLRRVNFCSMADHMHMDGRLANTDHETSMQKVKQPIAVEKHRAGNIYLITWGSFLDSLDYKSVSYM